MLCTVLLPAWALKRQRSATTSPRWGTHLFLSWGKSLTTSSWLYPLLSTCKKQFFLPLFWTAQDTKHGINPCRPLQELISWASPRDKRKPWGRLPFISSSAAPSQKAGLPPASFYLPVGWKETIFCKDSPNPSPPSEAWPNHLSVSDQKRGNQPN